MFESLPSASAIAIKEKAYAVFFRQANLSPRLLPDLSPSMFVPPPPPSCEGSSACLWCPKQGASDFNKAGDVWDDFPSVACRISSILGGGRFTTSLLLFAPTVVDFREVFIRAVDTLTPSHLRRDGGKKRRTICFASSHAPLTPGEIFRIALA